MNQCIHEKSSTQVLDKCYLKCCSFKGKKKQTTHESSRTAYRSLQILRVIVIMRTCWLYQYESSQCASSLLILDIACLFHFCPLNIWLMLSFLIFIYFFFYFFIFLILKSLILTCVPKHEPPSHLPPHNMMSSYVGFSLHFLNSYWDWTTQVFSSKNFLSVFYT